MPRTRVYVDTSVFGGVNDEEFAEPTQRFFDRVRKGHFVLLISRETTRELGAAPQTVQAALSSLPDGTLESVPVDEAVRALAHAYLDAGIIGRASEADAIHVAAATVARADLVLSWNFRHLVRYENIRKFNGVNAIRGYGTIDIRSPLEVGYVDDEEKDL